jgi:hypothetical protein
LLLVPQAAKLKSVFKHRHTSLFFAVAILLYSAGCYHAAGIPLPKEEKKNLLLFSEELDTAKSIKIESKAKYSFWFSELDLMLYGVIDREGKKCTVIALSPAGTTVFTNRSGSLQLANGIPAAAEHIFAPAAKDFENIFNFNTSSYSKFLRAFADILQ